MERRKPYRHLIREHLISPIFMTPFFFHRISTYRTSSPTLFEPSIDAYLMKLVQARKNTRANSLVPISILVPHIRQAHATCLAFQRLLRVRKSYGTIIKRHRSKARIATATKRCCLLESRPASEADEVVVEEEEDLVENHLLSMKRIGIHQLDVFKCVSCTLRGLEGVVGLVKKKDCKKSCTKRLPPKQESYL